MLFYVILGLTIWFLLLGLILGISRGFLGSFIRTIFISASVIGAVLASSFLAPVIAGILPINSIFDLPDEYKEANKLIATLITVVLTIILSIIIYLLLKWITCGLQSTFKGPRKERESRSALSKSLGALFGLIGGAISCIFICGQANTIFVNASFLLENADLNFSDVTVALEEYEASPIDEYLYSKTDNIITFVYNKTNDLVLKKADYKAPNEELKSLLKDYNSLMKIADGFNDIKNNFSSGITDANLNQVINLLNDIESTKADISPSVLAAAQDAINSKLNNELGVEVDLTQIDFKKAAKAIDKAFGIKDSLEKGYPVTAVEVNAFVDIIIDSKAFDTLDGVGLKLDNVITDSSTNMQIKDIINSKTGISDEQKTKYLKMLGIE